MYTCVTSSPAFSLSYIMISDLRLAWGEKGIIVDPDRDFGTRVSRSNLPLPPPCSPEHFP